MYFDYMKSNLDFSNKSLIHQLFAHLGDLDTCSLHELQEIIHSKVIHAKYDVSSGESRYNWMRFKKGFTLQITYKEICYNV